MTYMEVTRMTNEIAKFTLRTDSELMKKLRIVADYNGRSIVVQLSRQKSKLFIMN